MGELIDLFNNRSRRDEERLDGIKPAIDYSALGFVAADIVATPTASCTEADIRTAEVLEKLFRDGFTDQQIT